MWFNTNDDQLQERTSALVQGLLFYRPSLCTRLLRLEAAPIALLVLAHSSDATRGQVRRTEPVQQRDTNLRPKSCWIVGLCVRLRRPGPGRAVAERRRAFWAQVLDVLLAFSEPDEGAERIRREDSALRVVRRRHSREISKSAAHAARCPPSLVLIGHAASLTPY